MECIFNRHVTSHMANDLRVEFALLKSFGNEIHAYFDVFLYIFEHLEVGVYSNIEQRGILHLAVCMKKHGQLSVLKHNVIKCSN